MSARRRRVPGLSDVEYFAQSMYEPENFIVPGFNPGMPVINKPPIGLTDQEILCVIAYLQTLGGTATVTLQTSHPYYTAPGARRARRRPERRAWRRLPLPRRQPAGGGARGSSAPAQRARRGAASGRPQEGRGLNHEHPDRPRRGCRVRVPSLPSGQSADVGPRLVGGDLRPPSIWIHCPDSLLRHLDLHGHHLDCDPGVRVFQRGAS